MDAPPLDQAIERLRMRCPSFALGHVLARTGKCLLVRGTLAGQAAVAKLLVEPDPYWQARFVQEIGWYRFFEQHAPPVAVPRLLFAEENLAICIQEFLEGQSLGQTRYTSQPLPPNQFEALLEQLAQLHSWRAPQAPSTGALVADYREKFEGYAERGLLSEDDCANLARLLDCERSAPEFNHGDPLPSNCLAIGSGVALIDWEFAGYYLPGYDLALVWTLLQADGAARRRIVAVVQRQGVAAERAFIVNQMRVIAREINIHRKQTGGAPRDDRIMCLEADRDAVRVSMRAQVAQ